MIRIPIKIITLFITLKRMMFISYVDGRLNVWLEPQIFEFGKPASLHCYVTEKTKAIAWWIVEEDRSPKKISNEPVLNFTSANHSHSAIYECFHTFENNGFLKYSRKVLVLETFLVRDSLFEIYVCIGKFVGELVDWKFRFSTFPFDDVYFECNETRKSCYDRNGITSRDVNFLTPAFATCSVGFERSKIHLNRCPTNETVDERACNRSCFLNVEIAEENRRDANDLLQSTPPGNLDRRTTTLMISIPPSINGDRLHIFLLTITMLFLTIVVISVMMVSLAKNFRKKQSKEIYDFREDDDDDGETRGALTDECQTTTKTPKMASSKKILCFVKSCRGNIGNWC